MKTVILIVLFTILSSPCFAGTNITLRVIADEHAPARWQIYSHGTNVVLTIHQKRKLTSITSTASGYSVSHTDADGDSITDSIRISEVTGDILEILKRTADGKLAPTPQKDLDEMNKLVKKIKAGLPEPK